MHSKPLTLFSRTRCIVVGRVDDITNLVKGRYDYYEAIPLFPREASLRFAARLSVCLSVCPFVCPTLASSLRTESRIKFKVGKNVSRGATFPLANVTHASTGNRKTELSLDSNVVWPS